MSIKITERQECQRFVLDKPDEQNTLLNSYILHNNYIKLNFTKKKHTHTHKDTGNTLSIIDLVSYLKAFLSFILPNESWIFRKQKEEILEWT